MPAQTRLEHRLLCGVRGAFYSLDTTSSAYIPAVSYCISYKALPHGSQLEGSLPSFTFQFYSRTPVSQSQIPAAGPNTGTCPGSNAEG